jgi:hypothetical protein
VSSVWSGHDSSRRIDIQLGGQRSNCVCETKHRGHQNEAEYDSGTNGLFEDPIGFSKRDVVLHLSTKIHDDLHDFILAESTMAILIILLQQLGSGSI